MGFITNALSETNPMIAKPAEGLQNVDFTSAVNESLNNARDYGPDSRDYQDLVTALTETAKGNGDSAARRQLNETTAQNVQRTGALAGSMKGVDPALAAKMALDAGANANQQAAGQAATLRAQESAAARNQIGSVLGARTSLANQRLATTGALMNTTNANNIQNQLAAQQINAKIAAENAQERSNTATAAGNAVGAGVMTAIMGYDGGEVKYADGGQVAGVYNPSDNLLEFSPKANTSSFWDGLGKFKPGGGNKKQAPQASDQVTMGSNVSDYTGLRNTPGSNPGDYMNISDSSFSNALMEAHGGLIPGDHPDNDIVPAMLSPGEIVLPRSVTQSPEASDKAKAFVEAIKKEDSKKRKK